jgi:YHS domain-containing protein
VSPPPATQAARRKGTFPMDTHDTTTAPTTDPVCGMQVDPATAAASSEYDGQMYYFCSPGCKRQFDKDPEIYVGPHAPQP